MEQELQSKIDQINKLLKEVQTAKKKDKSLRLGTMGLHPGCILNAYREGDLTFDEAIKKLEEWRTHKDIMTTYIADEDQEIPLREVEVIVNDIRRK